MTKNLKKSYKVINIILAMFTKHAELVTKGLNTDMLDGYCKQLLKMIAKNEILI